jgi:hypothetical protein
MVALSRLISIVMLAALGGCIGYGPQRLKPGATVAEATSLMGPPTGRYARPDHAERLEFARGPAGEHTYMLDFDSSGRLSKWDQVLDETHFAAVPIGIGQGELREMLGRPSRIYGVATENRTVWSYRFRSNFCQWFEVALSTEGKVVETGYAPDPRCTRIVMRESPATPAGDLRG